MSFLGQLLCGFNQIGFQLNTVPKYTTPVVCHASPCHPTGSADVTHWVVCPQYPWWSWLPLAVLYTTTTTTTTDAHHSRWSIGYLQPLAIALCSGLLWPFQSSWCCFRWAGVMMFHNQAFLTGCCHTWSARFEKASS